VIRGTPTETSRWAEFGVQVPTFRREGLRLCQAAISTVKELYADRPSQGSSARPLIHAYPRRVSVAQPCPSQHGSQRAGAIAGISLARILDAYLTVESRCRGRDS